MDQIIGEASSLGTLVGHVAVVPVMRPKRDYRRWTDEERTLIRSLASSPGAADLLVERLHGRTRRSIVDYCQRTGIKLAPAERTLSNAWSAAEIEILRREWQCVGVRTMRDKLPGRSTYAIGAKARKLGLPFGIPQGHESLAAATRRTGYSYQQIREICSAAGVDVHVLSVYFRKPRRPTGKSGDTSRARSGRWHLDPDDLDHAISLYESRETLGGFCRRGGASICPSTLRARLIAAGHVNPSPGKRWRIPTELLVTVATAPTTCRRPRGKTDPRQMLLPGMASVAA